MREPPDDHPLSLREATVERWDRTLFGPDRRLDTGYRTRLGRALRGSAAGHVLVVGLVVIIGSWTVPGFPVPPVELTYLRLLPPAPAESRADTGEPRADDADGTEPPSVSRAPVWAHRFPSVCRTSRP